jgi:hypothetical protein
MSYYRGVKNHSPQRHRNTKEYLASLGVLRVLAIKTSPYAYAGDGMAMSESKKE